MEKAVVKRIYSDYKIHLKKCLTQRSGFARCGIHPMVGTLPSNREESLAEHTDGVISLAVATATHMPELLGPSQLARVLTLLLFHDAPEIISGDIADNGDRDDEAKDAEEMRSMRHFTDDWPTGRTVELLTDYKSFQDHNGTTWQLAYCLDKVDAVLRAIHYEELGCAGSVYKDPNISASDKEFAQAVGTGSAADVWAYHVIGRTEGCHGNELLFWLLVVAFEDVRGEAPDWLLPRFIDVNGYRPRDF